jgi:hypothetical protein
MEFVSNSALSFVPVSWSPALHDYVMLGAKFVVLEGGGAEAFCDHRTLTSCDNNHFERWYVFYIFFNEAHDLESDLWV